MPTYEYECKSCKYTFDVFQSMRDEPLKSCPKCGKEVRRLINGGNGIIFKGEGFYVSDKKGGAAKIDKDAKPESGKSGDSGKGGEESKAAPAKPPCSGCAKSETCPKAAS